MPDANLTFSQLADMWFEEKKLTVKITSQRTYPPQLKHLKKHFGTKKIKSITMHEYQIFLNNFAESHARNSVILLDVVAKEIFKYAMKYDILTKSPLTFAVIPKNDILVDLDGDGEELPKYLEKDELILFLNEAFTSLSYNFYAAIFVLAYTGMRRSELCALKWSMIDFENRTITIKMDIYFSSLNRENLKYVLLTPKTKKSLRKISNTNDVVEVLLKLRQLQLVEKATYASSWHNENFIFTACKNHPGYPTPPTHIYTKVKQIIMKVGLPSNLATHALRHTHTSLLAEAKVPLEAIQERLGQYEQQDNKPNISTCNQVC